MSIQTAYAKKLLSANDAANLLPKVGNIGIGMAVSAPPALLRAIEKRVIAKEIEKLNLYYLHSASPLCSTLLKYDYMDRIKPHPFFMGQAERDLIQQGIQEQRRVIFFMPSHFSEVPKIIEQHIELDTFIMTVSPMDKGGYFSCGTNSDYTIPAARFAKKINCRSESSHA